MTWDSVREHLLIIDRSWSYGELRETKTGHARTVEMIPQLADDLAAWRPAKPAPGALVAPKEVGGFLDIHTWRRRVFCAACERAGVEPRPTPYDLRHSACSLWIHEGRSIAYVAANMGHASATMTLDRYAHAFHEAQLGTGTSMTAVAAARVEVCTICAQPATVRRLRQAAPGA